MFLGIESAFGRHWKWNTSSKTPICIYCTYIDTNAKSIKKNARENPGSAKNTTNSSGKALATPKARKSSSGKAWQPLEREKSSGGAPQGHPEPKRQTPTAVEP